MRIKPNMTTETAKVAGRIPRPFLRSWERIRMSIRAPPTSGLIRKFQSNSEDTKMSKFKPNYKAQYPGITDEMLDVLKKSDRKMEYMERDLKYERYLVDQENESITLIKNREDSFDRLFENNYEFADTTENVEDTVIHNLMAEKLHRCLHELTDDEQSLINALYFCSFSERQYAEMIGISQKAVNKRKAKILSKLCKLLNS